MNKSRILTEDDLLDIFACQYNCKIEEIDKDDIVRDDLENNDLKAVSVAWSIEECLGVPFWYECDGKSIGQIIDYVLNLEANQEEEEML
jgi:hypothetical protein